MQFKPPWLSDIFYINVLDAFSVSKIQFLPLGNRQLSEIGIVISIASNE